MHSSPNFSRRSASRREKVRPYRRRPSHPQSAARAPLPDIEAGRPAGGASGSCSGRARGLALSAGSGEDGNEASGGSLAGASDFRERGRKLAGFATAESHPNAARNVAPRFAACGCPAENSSRNPFHSPRSGRPIDDQDQIQVGTILRARRHQLSIHRSDRRREPCRKDAHGNLHHGIASQRRHSRALGTHRVQGCTADIISRSRHRF